MKTTRVRNHTIKFLSDGKCRTTLQIEQHINKKLRNGTTSNQLGNILGKDKKNFKKVGFAQVTSLSNEYFVSEWVLTDEAIAAYNSSQGRRGRP